MNEPAKISALPLQNIVIVNSLSDSAPKCWKSACACNHRECDMGWIFFRYKVVEEKRANGVSRMVETEYDGTRPCPTCDPERAQIFDSSKSPEELAQRLRERSDFKVIENYDKADERRTRTL